MKIAFSCGSPRWGGLERMAVLLSRGLAHRGHDVVLLCRDGSPVHENLAGELPCETVLGGGDMNPLVIARAAAALRRHRPDVVIGNMYKDPRWTGIAAWTLGIPFVFRHEIDEPYRSGSYYRFIYSRPAYHVVNSAATRRTLLDSAPWLPPEQVVTIPNGIHVDRWAEAEPLSLGLPEDALVFACIGRWEWRKGVFELASAWPEVQRALPNAHLILAGWGPEEQRLRDTLAGAENVHWLGMCDDVPALMKAIDVLVAPTHREGFGLAVLEGMAAGRPVISTDASSIPDLVRHGEDGLLVPVGDAVALGKAMIELGSNPDMRHRMGSSGVRRAGRFSIEAMLSAHEELLEVVVAHHALGRDDIRREWPPPDRSQAG